MVKFTVMVMMIKRLNKTRTMKKSRKLKPNKKKLLTRKSWKTRMKMIAETIPRSKVLMMPLLSSKTRSSKLLLASQNNKELNRSNLQLLRAQQSRSQ